jgi:hypothetical protein
LIDVERNMVIGHHSAEVLHEIDHLKKCHDVYLFFIDPPSPPEAVKKLGEVDRSEGYLQNCRMRTLRMSRS